MTENNKPNQMVTDEELKQYESATMEQAFTGSGHTGRTENQNCKDGICTPKNRANK